MYILSPSLVCVFVCKTEREILPERGISKLTFGTFLFFVVLNKYFPPDFDPSKVPKGKRVRSEEKQMKVRMMLPMSVRCNTCGNFMYKGTKFNTRMEDVKGEDYLGIKIFRFYYKCTNCSAEFCMKTDPKTTDYIVEAGATRNYEPWRDKERAVEDVKAKRDEEEKGNAMKALENRTIDSKREMDILTALDEMKSLKARHEGIGLDAALAAIQKAGLEGSKSIEEQMDEEDERQVQQMLLQQAGMVNRLSDSSEEDEVQAGGDGSVVGSTRPPKKARGKSKMTSVAADALQEEEEEEKDTIIYEFDPLNAENAECVASRDDKTETPVGVAHGSKQEGKSATRSSKSRGGQDVSEFKSVPSFGIKNIKKAIKTTKTIKSNDLRDEDKPSEQHDALQNAVLGLAEYGSSDSASG